MKTHKTNRWRKIIGAGRSAIIFLQLSVIILGIIVTFMVSDVVTDYAERRDIVSILQLVEDELELNKQELKRISDRRRFE